jgi:mannose-6-phosphate isomerase-like protein (cupin superfamily)
MKAAKASSALERPNAHNVSVKKLMDTEHAQVLLMELKPGEGLKSHITPVDVFFYILDGSGIVEIGEESEKVEKDTLVESPAGIPHRLVNDGKGPFKFLVVKIPRQRETTKVL